MQLWVKKDEEGSDFSNLNKNRNKLKCDKKKKI